MALENLALSPQCGSVLQGYMIGWGDEQRRRDLLVDTARKVWSS